MRIDASNTRYSLSLSDSTRRTDTQTAFDKLLEEAASGSTDLDVAGHPRVSPGGLVARPLLLPTANNLRALSTALASDLRSAFEAAGIPEDPPVDLQYDYATNRVRVSGDRADTAQIEQMLNANPGLAAEIHTISALGSHAKELPRHMAFQQEYRSSPNPEGVVARYSDLFSGTRQSAPVVIRFTGSSVTTL